MVSIDGLAGGDMTKWKHFEEMPVFEFLHKLLYAKRKGDEQKREAELNRLKNRR